MTERLSFIVGLSESRKHVRREGEGEESKKKNDKKKKKSQREKKKKKIEEKLGAAKKTRRFAMRPNLPHLDENDVISEFVIRTAAWFQVRRAVVFSNLPPEEEITNSHSLIN